MKEKIRKYIDTWEKRCYPNGIPDEAPLELEQSANVPSYRRICIAIMKNDVTLESLGFSRPFCAIYSEIKKQELNERSRKNISKI